MQTRCAVLQARGVRERVHGDRLTLGMTCLLQALAAMAINKGAGKDMVPAEALKELDWHSKLLVLQCCESA